MSKLGTVKAGSLTGELKREQCALDVHPFPVLNSINFQNVGAALGSGYCFRVDILVR